MRDLLTHWRKLAVIAVLALVSGAAGYTIAAWMEPVTVTVIQKPLSSPVDVTVTHEESGEVAEVTVTNEDGTPVQVDETTEGWLGNEAAPDGLYTEDPKED